MINLIISRDKKNNQETVFKRGTDIVTNPIEIANEFNKFFVNIGPKLAKVKKLMLMGKIILNYMNNPKCENF